MFDIIKSINIKTMTSIERGPSMESQEEKNPFAPENFHDSDGGTEFGKQRDVVLQQTIKSYDEMGASASRDRRMAGGFIADMIENNGLFVPNEVDKKKYDNELFADDALEDTVSSWKRDTLKETIGALETLGKIDKPKKKE